MNVFDDERFMKKLNKIFDLISNPKADKMPRIIFKDDEGFDHKLEFMWFQFQNNYWLGHAVTKKSKVYIAENWTIDGRTRKITQHCPSYPIILRTDKCLEEVSFDMDDVLNKMDLVIVELI